MQFSLAVLFTLVALAVAAPVPANTDDVVARTASPQLSTESEVMTDAAGNVVPFDSTAVYLDATAKGF